jgi:hypothetical protein
MGLPKRQVPVRDVVNQDKGDQDPITYRPPLLRALVPRHRRRADALTSTLLTCPANPLVVGTCHKQNVSERGSSRP